MSNQSYAKAIVSQMQRAHIARAIVACKLFLALTAHAHSDPIHPTFFHPSNQTKLSAFLAERVLTIQYDYEVIATGEITTQYGTAILVSPSGFALTARHVIEPLIDKSKYRMASPVQIWGGAKYFNRLKWSGQTRVGHTESDIAGLFITTETNSAPEKYLCIEPTPIETLPGAVVRITARRFRDTATAPWEFVDRHTQVDQTSGPDDLIHYWGLVEKFDVSMSGGAIIHDGRVAAIVSASLNNRGKPADSANYAHKINLAKDVWDGAATICGPPILNEKQYTNFDSFAKFLSGTCEGALSWQSRASGYWTFRKSGGYRVRLDDLPCSKPCACADGEKSVRMVINHTSVAGSRQCQALTRPFNLPRGASSYYGAQVVPIIAPSAIEGTNTETWLWRTSGLFRRSTFGEFSAMSGTGTQIIVSNPPQSFNNALEGLSVGGNPSCPMNVEVCEDIAGLNQFDKFTGARGQWPGFVRQEPRPISTLADNPTRSDWKVQPSWLTQNLQVKSWILKYSINSTVRSNRPVDFQFCVNSNWQGFFVRSFAPERGVAGKNYRVHFVETD